MKSSDNIKEREEKFSDMSHLSTSPSQSDMSDLSNLSNSPSQSDIIKEREENVSDMSDLSSSPSQSDMSDFSNSPSQSDMSDLSDSPSQSEPRQYTILALPALHHIPEMLRGNNRRTFYGVNAVVQDSEEVITYILDNEHVIDAVPLSMAYPEDSHGRGGYGRDSYGGGGRGEYQGTTTSSEIDDAHSTSAGIFTENPPIQAQPSSTNVMDDDVIDETSEHHIHM